MSDFIRQIVAEDLSSGKHTVPVTRFPPEPNGYLHIGHAKSICLNFGLAEEHAGVGARCHLRFDDTNPEKEEQEYVDSIKEDVRWLGFDWGEHEYYASDYFEQLYEWACGLICAGLAYVDDSSPEEIRASRGSLTVAGVPGPYRERGEEENLDLFRRMRAGEFEDGSRVLRAKIDLGHVNMNMRDPVLYRILRKSHHRTGDDWLIYPTYDYAHGQSDALEGITHSLCTLEFEHHRPLYDWFLGVLPVPARPRQIEFARLNLTYTVMSKRKLQRLVAEGHVAGWDDPRMPTLAGMRRRGVPPAALRAFCGTVGITKYAGTTDVALLEHAVRDELNRVARRYMGVLRPLRLVITNLVEGEEGVVRGPVNPEDEGLGEREIPFGRELWIERDDFMEEAPKGYFRLQPGGEVRLRYAYVVRCDEVVRGVDGEVEELRCTADLETLGRAPEGRKVKGVIHWVSARHGVEAEVRLYDRLFSVEDPDVGDDFVAHLNPGSVEVLGRAYLERLLVEDELEGAFQLERLGYFVRDRVAEAAGGGVVLGRTIGLRDSWK
jgi:glutaminyl-tRNA synthetase